jgi:SAM-dependent methyltransferase
MPSVNIPMPPLEMRRMVGPTDPEDFDNPSGEPIYAGFGLPLDAYDSVFDFGCGCGRVARQLLQQNPRPRRYVGIDAHRGMIDWCRENLSPIDPNFQFFHHDVMMFTPLGVRRGTV